MDGNEAHKLVNRVMENVGLAIRRTRGEKGVFGVEDDVPNRRCVRPQFLLNKMKKKRNEMKK